MVVRRFCKALSRARGGELLCIRFMAVFGLRGRDDLAGGSIFRVCVPKMGTLDVRSATVQLCMGPLRLSKIRKRRYTQAAPWDFENGELL